MKEKKFILFAIGAFFLLIVLVAIYMWQNNFRIHETGSIGDGFNGLITPIITFFAALLVYLSFKEQIEANKILSSQWQFDLFLRILSDIDRNFDGLSITLKKDNSPKNVDETFKGQYAFDIFGKRRWHELENIENTLSSFHVLLVEFKFIVERIENSEIKEKEYLRLRCHDFYMMKLLFTFNTIRDRIIKENKGDAYFDLIKEMNDINAMAFKLEEKNIWPTR